MAVRRGIANFADTYLKFYLQKKLAEQQAEAVSSRQMALNDKSHRQAIERALLPLTPGPTRGRLGQEIGSAKSLGELLDPGSIREQMSGSFELAGEDPSGAQETNAGLMLPTKTQELASVPGENGVPTLKARAPMFPTERPEIADLIAQREAKKGNILDTYSFEDDRKLAMEKAIKREGVLGTEEGTAQVFPAVKGREIDLSAAKGQQEIKNRLAMLTQVGPAEVKQAGAISGAQAGAAESARARSRYANRDIIAAVEEQIAKARLAGKPVDKTTSAIIGDFGQRIITISQALNQSDSRMNARQEGVLGMLGNATGIAADNSPLVFGGQAVKAADGTPMTRQDGIRELSDLTDGLTSTMLRALGRVGTPTENDEKRTRALIPTYGRTSVESVNAINNFNKLLSALEQVGQRYGAIDPSLPPEQIEAEVARRLQEAQQGIGGAIDVNDFLNGLR